MSEDIKNKNGLSRRDVLTGPGKGAILAVRIVCDCNSRHRLVCRAVLLPLPLPARRGAGDPWSLAHV